MFRPALVYPRLLGAALVLRRAAGKTSGALNHRRAQIMWIAIFVHLNVIAFTWTT